MRLFLRWNPPWSAPTAIIIRMLPLFMGTLSWPPRPAKPMNEYRSKHSTNQGCLCNKRIDRPGGTLMVVEQDGAMYPRRYPSFCSGNVPALHPIGLILSPIHRMSRSRFAYDFRMISTFPRPSRFIILRLNPYQGLPSKSRY